LLPDARDVPNLPGTRSEIAVVKDLYSDRFAGDGAGLTLSGQRATLPEMTAALKRPWRCIHFAGHGLFIPPALARSLSGHFGDDLVLTKSDQLAAARGPTASPRSDKSHFFVNRNQMLLSGLVLAPDTPTDQKPGFLTAEELGGFDLRQTDLVVLSACETGIGCTAGGDGVLGLTRGFLTAGARSVVSSLWKVDDAATSDLMEQFYRNLWQPPRLTKAQALRQAQLAVLNNAGKIPVLRNNLLAQVRRDYPELAESEARTILNRSRGGLIAAKEIDLGEYDPSEDSDGSDDVPPPVADPRYPNRAHPALWAAFILNGDPR
jgi:CHAT domain-containing protein